MRTVDLLSHVTLLPAEIVIIDPDLITRKIIEPSARNHLAIRKAEINKLLKNGKVVFCFLFSFCSTNKNVSNYDWLPDEIYKYLIKYLQIGSGNDTRISNKELILKEYYDYFKDNISYTCYFNEETDYPIMTKFGGGLSKILKHENGFIIFLPQILFKNSDAEVNFIRIIQKVVSTLLKDKTEKPDPEWLKTISFEKEIILNNHIKDIDVEMNALESKKTENQRNLNQINKFKILLKGGGGFEDIVRESFSVLGFKNIINYDDGNYEIDIIGENENGTRFIAEINERENGQILFPVYSKLLARVNYDLEKRIENREKDGNSDEIKKAKGILVGNGFSSLPPDAKEKNSQFAQHIYKNAENDNIALLTSNKLFYIIRDIIDGKIFERDKELIRRKIIGTNGELDFEFKQNVNDK